MSNLDDYVLAGLIQQAANDAAYKKLQQICAKEGVDSAYWHISITTDIAIMDENFKAMKSIQIKPTYDWNGPDGSKEISIMKDKK